MSPEQRPEADVNIEFQSTAKLAPQAQSLAWALHAANEKYATDYPAAVGPHMTNTDSTPFMDLVPAISLRENERGTQIGSGWDPHWHQPTDVFATFTRQGLPPRPERGADDARGRRAADRRDGEEVARTGRGASAKGRLEAFSDGVIAVIITIMVLELKAPEGPTGTRSGRCCPTFLAYVLSFVFLGIYWNNHHHLLHATDRVTGGVLWANLHLLFWLSLVPFTTAWVGRAPGGGRAQRGVRHRAADVRRRLHDPVARILPSRARTSGSPRPSAATARACCRCCSTRGHHPGVRQPVAVGCDLRDRGADVAGAGPSDREVGLGGPRRLTIGGRTREHARPAGSARSTRRRRRAGAPAAARPARAERR